MCQNDLAHVPLKMPPPGDDVWFNRPYPRFVGETVWLVSPNHESLPLAVDRLDRDLQAWRDEAALNARIEAGEKFWPVQRYQRQHRTAGYVLAASGAPSAPTAQLARIDQIYQNFSADLTLLDMETMEFASEQLQHVPYGQMRSIMPSVRRLELCGPDLTMPARDAAMAELDRLHSTQNRAASHIRDSRKVGRCLPIELKCGCVGVYPIRDSGINERQRVVCRVGPWVPTLEQSQFWPFVESIEHDQSGRCPIGKFMDAAIDARIDSAGQQSEGRRLEEICRELKTGKHTMDDMANFLEALSCDAGVVSFIRTFSNLHDHQRRFKIRETAERKCSVQICRLRCCTCSGCRLWPPICNFRF